MKYLSICSGICAATAAWQPLGWTCVGFAEIEPFPSAVLAHHYKGIPNYGDFTKIGRPKGPKPAEFQLLVGGTPCQSFSIAGLRGGLDDPRGNLALEFLALVERTRPQWFVWENVPGVRSSDEGRALGSFLGAVAQLGYGWAYRSLDAQYFGLAQRRERVFVVGYLGDWRPPAAVLLERTSLSGHPAPSREAGQRTAGTFSSRSTAGGGLGTDFECDGGIVAGTLDSGAGRRRGAGTPPETLTVATLDASYGKLQGASGQDMNHGHSHLVAFGGNNTSGEIDIATAVNAHPSRRYDFESETFVTHALRADGFDASEDGTGRGTPIIPFDTTQVTSKTNRSNPKAGAPCHPISAEGHPPAIAFSCKDHGADAGDIAPTLRGMGHHKSHPNAGGQVAIVTTLAIRGRGKESNLEYREDGTANAILTPNGGRGGIGVGAVSVIPILEVGKGSSSRGEGPNGTGIGQPGDPMYTLQAGAQHAIGASSAVRRLTPVECERLMGFSDNFTKIVYRKKPAADGPRYKALGNSMAVPVMAWIGRRIQMVNGRIHSCS